MPQIRSNFTLRSKLPNFERDSFTSLQDMRNVNPGWMDEGHISYCKETKKHYTFSVENEYNDETGYFRLFATNLSSSDTTSSPDNDYGCGCCCIKGDHVLHFVFCNLEDMKNSNMEDIKLGQLVYCRETCKPYYSEFDPMLDVADPNQASFDEITGYFRPFGVGDSIEEDIEDIKTDIKSLKLSDNSLLKRIVNLEANVGTGTGSNGSIDLSNYVTIEDLNSKGFLTDIPDEYITEDELKRKGYLTAVPGEYITEDELKRKGYLTAVPGEYITSSELDSKGYLTRDDIGDIDINLDNYVTVDALNPLKTQLASLLWSNATFSLGGGKSVHTSTDQTIYLKATFTSENITPDIITITLLNGTIVKSENTKKLEHSDSFNKNVAGTYTYSAVAKVGDLTKTAATSVYVYNRIYCGMGQKAEDVMIDANMLTAKNSAANTYDKTATANDQRFYLLVPDDSNIIKPKSFTMGGAPVNINTETKELNGVNYKVYSTGASYDEGTTISVSVEN